MASGKVSKIESFAGKATHSISPLQVSLKHFYHEEDCNLFDFHSGHSAFSWIGQVGKHDVHLSDKYTKSAASLFHHDFNSSKHALILHISI